MKKLLCCIVTIMMISALCTGALAEAADITGEWYANAYGSAFKMTLNADGYYTLQMMLEGGEVTDVSDGTWEFDGMTLIMDKGTKMEFPLSYDAEANSIILEENGNEFLFTREMVKVFEAAPARTNANLEEFSGTWVCTLVGYMGMYAEPEQMKVNLGLSIDGTSVTMEPDDDLQDVLYISEITLEGVFADGVMTLTIPSENEDILDTVFTLQLLEDGSMSARVQLYSDELVFYMSME